MNAPVLYFHNAAARISYMPAGYLCLAWQPTAVTVAELKAIYEHVLAALQAHRTPHLMSIHGRRPPLPAEVQIWLTHDWIPRAVALANYRRCAIVEASEAVSRLAARAIGTAVGPALRYQYFDTTEAAERWLLKPA